MEIVLHSHCVQINCLEFNIDVRFQPDIWSCEQKISFKDRSDFELG